MDSYMLLVNIIRMYYGPKSMGQSLWAKVYGCISENAPLKITKFFRRLGHQEGQAVNQQNVRSSDSEQVLSELEKFHDIISTI